MAECISKSQRVYAHLRQGILEGKYGPGYRFVLDRIARDEEVSPVPVREAVRLLEAEGLVTFQRNVGAVVSSIDKEDYAEVMESLAVLEGYATALARDHLTEDDLATASRINNEIRDRMTSAFDPRIVTDLNQRFHHTLTSACNNGRLIDLLEREWDRVTIVRRAQFAFTPTHSLRSVDEHAEIIAAIRAGASHEHIEELARQHKLRSMRDYVNTDHSTTDLSA